jgi:hypothetical protein
MLGYGEREEGILHKSNIKWVYISSESEVGGRFSTMRLAGLSYYVW